MTNREIFQEVFWRTVSIEKSSLFAVSMVQDILVSVIRCIIRLILDFDWRLKPRWQDTTKTLQRARNKIADCVALYQTDYILRHATVSLCRKEVAIEWLQLSCDNKQHSHVAKINSFRFCDSIVACRMFWSHRVNTAGDWSSAEILNLNPGPKQISL